MKGEIAMWFENLKTICLDKVENDHVTHIHFFRDSLDQDFNYVLTNHYDYGCGTNIVDTGHIKYNDIKSNLLHFIIDLNFIVGQKDYFFSEV